MSKYILSIVGISIIVGIVDILTPENVGSRKFLRLLCGLAVAAVMISPLSNFISYVGVDFWGELEEHIYTDESEKYEDILTDEIENASRKSIETSARALLCENFDISEDDCSVSVRLVKDERGFKIDRVAVYLSGVAIFKNPYDIEEYFESLLACECVTIIE